MTVKPRVGGRIHGLDGIRAFAVLAVLAHHFLVPIRGGQYGVDVFFVLSGYLITTLLLREAGVTGRIDRRAFYLRRARRLLPALVLCIAITVVLDLASRQGGGHLAVGLPSVLLYVANWTAAFDGQALGYFGQMWSLAIEEQFYLLWPIILGVAAWRHRSLPRILPTLIVASAIGRAVAWLTLGGGVSLWTPLRADGLLIGAALAYALSKRPDRVARWCTPGAAWAAAAALAVLIVAAPPEAWFVNCVGFTTVAVFTSIVIGHVVTAPDSRMVRALSLPPLVGIGRVSYGLYLYHYPIVVFLLANYDVRVARYVGLPVVAMVTVTSWFVVERPFQAGGRRDAERNSEDVDVKIDLTKERRSSVR